MSSPGVFMLKQRVKLIPFLREEGLYSQPVLDTDHPMTLRARIWKTNKRIRRPGGEEILISSEAQIHSPVHEITERDSIELPGGKTPPIVDVKSEPDQRGRTRLYLVRFGNSRRTG